MSAAAGAKTFAGKFLENLDRIERRDIEAFLSRLLREKNFFEAVLSNLLEGVVVTDPDGRILFLNRSARGLLGLGARRRIVGDPLLNHVAAGELNDALRDYDPSDHGIQIREVALFRPNERFFHVTLIPVRDEEGQLVSIVALIRDQTERRREEERRIQSERLSALATLTAGVAHEIKNPLNSINLHAHLLRKAIDRLEDDRTPDDLERTSRSAAILLEEVDRLSRVVDEFLQAARPTEPQFEMMNVNDVLQRLVQAVEPEAAQRGVQLELDLDPETPPSRIDEIQLTQAFRNVVKNGIEAIDSDEGVVRIHSRLTSKAILVEFQDNGRGIAPDELKKIFEPYVTTKFEGTGLGLMIVYRIVTEHRGSIDVQSRPGEGTTFRIALPLGPRPRRLLPEKTGDAPRGKS